MHACSGNMCTEFHSLSFINNREKLDVLPIGFSSYLVNLSYSSNVVVHFEFPHSDLGLSVRVHPFKNVFELFHVKTSPRELSERKRYSQHI